MSDTIEFLKQNRDHIRLSTIERETGIYQGALSKAIREAEYRHLTDEQESAIQEYFCKTFKALKKYLPKSLVDKK